jgi:hypothetical protein
VTSGSKSRRCLKCGRELAAIVRGRPPVYCGTACRRSAEHEVRRADVRLARLEDEALLLRGVLAGVRAPVPPLPVAEARLEWIRGEISDQEQRLRSLFEGQGS